MTEIDVLPSPIANVLLSDSFLSITLEITLIFIDQSLLIQFSISFQYNDLLIILLTDEVSWIHYILIISDKVQYLCVACDHNIIHDLPF